MSTVCLCMIVKNEAHIIRRCLDSAIATGNDQITVADLGAGMQAGTASIGGNQTLSVVAGDLTLSANIGNSRIGTVATTDAL